LLVRGYEADLVTFLMLTGWFRIAGYRKITVDCRESTLCDVSLATVLRLLLCCHIEAKRVAFDRRISRGESCRLLDSRAVSAGR
jgi:hypothetical protein